MKILIVGGGIAGLTTAVFLRKSGADVTIVEKAPQWATIGYVIALFPSGISILKKLGLHDQVIEQGKILADYRFKDIRGGDMWGFPFSELGVDLPVVEIERSSLHHILAEANRDTHVIMDTHVVALSQDKDGVDVELSNGTKDRYDLVVGADGINSSVRSFITPRVKKSYTGFTYWLAWIKPLAKMPDGIEVQLGRGNIFGIFPDKSKEHAVVTFGIPAKEHSYADAATATKIIRERFAGNNAITDESIANLVLDSGNPFHSDDDEVHDRQWYSGRVVLMGDAVHALSPILAIGASMAMEDAYVLADELAKNQPLEKSLAAYKRRRYPRVALLQKSSTAIHKAILASQWMKSSFSLLFRGIIGPQYKKIVTRLSRENP